MAKFEVTVLIEADDVLNEDVKEYVKDAVECWGGQFHPDSPFFGDNKTVSKVTVKRPRKARKK